MSAYTIEIEEVKTENAFEGTGFWARSRAVCRMVRHFSTHPWRFRGRVNRKLSIDLLGGRRNGRLGHFVLWVLQRSVCTFLVRIPSPGSVLPGRG